MNDRTHWNSFRVLGNHEYTCRLCQNTFTLLNWVHVVYENKLCRVSWTVLYLCVRPQRLTVPSDAVVVPGTRRIHTPHSGRSKKKQEGPWDRQSTGVSSFPVNSTPDFVVGLKITIRDLSSPTGVPPLLSSFPEVNF